MFEVSRGKILSRSAYNGFYSAMYTENDEIFIDSDDIDLDPLEPIPFLDEDCLYMNDWIYGKLIQ